MKTILAGNRGGQLLWAGVLAAVLPAAMAWGQAASSPGTTPPSVHPFGTLPATEPSPSTTTGAGGLGSGQPAWLAAPLAVPAFPGAGLLNENPPFLAGVKVNHTDLSYQQGDVLTVDFTSECDAHLYLLYHQADGTSLLLFPNQAHIANRVAARQWVSVPESGEDFRFRVSPPFGTEVLQVLATVEPASELDALVGNHGRAAPVSRELLAALETRLKKDLSGWTEHRVPIRTAARAAVTSQADKPARVGLFIGVNRFQVEDEGEAEKNLRFRLGAELMAKVMMERGQLDPQRTKTLVGEEATRANIEAAITRWLPSVTRPGDTVFLFYAGHGALVKNLDGTKADGKDGVLTTYDNEFQSRKLSSDEWDAEARKCWVTDNTLARWLQELPGRQIAVMVSSCHAGSLIDAQLLAKFASREVTRVKGISEVNVAVLVSCLPDEQTLSNTKKPVWLAYYLAEAMGKLPAPVTLEQAFAYYRQEHRRRLAEDGDTGFHEPLLTDTALLPIVLAP